MSYSRKRGKSCEFEMHWSPTAQDRSHLCGGILQVLVLVSPGAEQCQEVINEVISAPISDVLKA